MYFSVIVDPQLLGCEDGAALGALALPSLDGLPIVESPRMLLVLVGMRPGTIPDVRSEGHVTVEIGRGAKTIYFELLRRSIESDANRHDLL